MGAVSFEQEFTGIDLSQPKIFYNTTTTFIKLKNYYNDLNLFRIQRNNFTLSKSREKLFLCIIKYKNIKPRNCFLEN